MEVQEENRIFCEASKIMMTVSFYWSPKAVETDEGEDIANGSNHPITPKSGASNESKYFFFFITSVILKDFCIAKKHVRNLPQFAHFP